MNSETETTNTTSTTDNGNDAVRRLATPPLSSTEDKLLRLYCQKFHHKLGPGLLMAAMREIRRELGIPEVPEPQPSTSQSTSPLPSGA